MKDDNLVTDQVSLRNAKLYFRNFAGKKTQYTPEGLRLFGVFIDPDLAERLAKDGWNVKLTKPSAREPEPRPFLRVEVSYKKRPPTVVVKNGKVSNRLEENEIKMLDWVEIAKVDLIINPYNWEVNGKKGVKGFLKSIYVTTVQDEFEAEYFNDVPDDEDDVS